MLRKDATEPMSDADERARKIFRRMDVNRDGLLTEEEFLRGCLEDDELSMLLAPNVIELCE